MKFLEVRVNSHLFNSMGKFELALRRMGLSNLKIEECLEHESAHFKRAKDLGYRPAYYIQISKLKLFGITIAPAFNYSVILDRDPVYEDLKAIALAPKNPSPSDYKMIEEFKN